MDPSLQDSMVYTTHISYLEIYNEVGYDLLDRQHEASNMEDLPSVFLMQFLFCVHIHYSLCY